MTTFASSRPVAELSNVRIEADKAVIGLASGYNETHIAPFLRSLKRTGYDGAVVLLVDDRSIAAMQGAELLADVQLVRIRTLRSPAQPTLRKLAQSTLLWPLVCAGGYLATWLAGNPGASNGSRSRARQRAVAGRALHPMFARHFFYRQLVENSSLDQVMLTDVRDVLFQADPFEFLAGDVLLIGLERDNYTLGSEPYNRIWIQSGFGRAALKQVADRQVACAGAIVASGAAASDYLRWTTDTILDLPPQGIVPFGTDQGVHNVGVWTDAVDGVQVIQPLAGPIATLNAYTMDELSFDQRGLLLNRDGSLINIVHQYDRVEGLADRLLGALQLT